MTFWTKTSKMFDFVHHLELLEEEKLQCHSRQLQCCQTMTTPYCKVAARNPQQQPKQKKPLLRTKKKEQLLGSMEFMAVGASNLDGNMGSCDLGNSTSSKCGSSEFLDNSSSSVFHSRLSEPDTPFYSSQALRGPSEGRSLSISSVRSVPSRTRSGSRKKLKNRKRMASPKRPKLKVQHLMKDGPVVTTPLAD